MVVSGMIIVMHRGVPLGNLGMLVLPSVVLKRPRPMERTKRNAVNEVIPEYRLHALSEGEPRSSRYHVMFQEGKMMADEILFLRAEVIRLSNNKPPKK
ncbi:hypothetical protein [Salmonella phage vB_SenAc-pSC20]|nr:hypothetical protein [Salmonella phage vB_SenAc-pSC20]